MIEKMCENCGKNFMFKDSPSRVATGRGKYCSRPCSISATHKGLPKPKSRENAKIAAKAITGRTPWNAKTPVRITCEVCGAAFDVPPHRADVAKVCSRACSHEKKRRLRGAAHPLHKPKPVMACEQCGKEVAVKPSLVTRFRFCSRRCSGAWVAATWPRTSSIEQMLRNELARRGVAFSPDHSVGPFVVDIALPNAMLAVEADGTYWHGLDKQKPKDRRKDSYLRRNGWTVLRLPEIDIRANVAACVDRIMAAANPRQEQPS